MWGGKVQWSSTHEIEVQLVPTTSETHVSGEQTDSER